MRGILLAPLALSLVPMATSAQAEPPRGVATAANWGLSVAPAKNRLVVVGSTAPNSPLGLKAGDQIVAVNGRRVATETAFVNRLSQATNIAIVRDGRTQIIGAPVVARTNPNQAGVPSSVGWMNPALMVRTSQGVMHRDAAARLGLAGTPLVVTEAEREALRRAAAQGTSFFRR